MVERKQPQRAVPSGQDSVILPARVANPSVIDILPPHGAHHVSQVADYQDVEVQ